MGAKDIFIDKQNRLVTSKQQGAPEVPYQRVELNLRNNENKVRWNVLCDPGDTVTIVFERKNENGNDNKFKRKGPFQEHFQKEGIDTIQYDDDVDGWEDEKTGPVKHEPPPDSYTDWKFTIFRTQADGTSVYPRDPGLRIRK